jgi:hypothetical protein
MYEEHLFQYKSQFNTLFNVLSCESMFSNQFLFSTAPCFGPHRAIIRQHYDRTAKIIELLNMYLYLGQHVDIIKLCLS